MQRRARRSICGPRFGPQSGWTRLQQAFAPGPNNNLRGPPCWPCEHQEREPMPALTEDTVLIRQALAYVIELYRELSEENGAPSLGTQNQVVDFILAAPELREAVARWGRRVDSDEATTAPPRRLPCDPAYRLIRDYLQSIMDQPVFTRPGQAPPDRR